MVLLVQSTQNHSCKKSLLVPGASLYKIENLSRKEKQQRSGRDIKVKVLLAQSCLTLCDPMDYSLPGSSIDGVLQARILEWVALPFSRGSSQPRD